MSRFLTIMRREPTGFTLVVNGIEANGPGVTPSAVQEVKINNNPYSARFSRPGRARLEIVTKSGSPAYHGSLKFSVSRLCLRRTQCFCHRQASRAPPVLRRLNHRTYRPKQAHQLPARARRRPARPAGLHRSRSRPPPPSRWVLVRFAQTIPNPTHHFFGSGRIFHDFSNGDQFWIGYSYEHRSVNNQSVGGTILPSAGTDTRFS